MRAWLGLEGDLNQLGADDRQSWAEIAGSGVGASAQSPHRYPRQDGQVLISLKRWGTNMSMQDNTLEVWLHDDQGPGCQWTFLGRKFPFWIKNLITQCTSMAFPGRPWNERVKGTEFSVQLFD